MNYEDYIQLQIGGEGHLNKPIRYAKGEQRAIDWFLDSSFMTTFTSIYKRQKHAYILSIGCGEGWGINYFNQCNFNKTYGVELHPEKVEYAKLKSIFSPIWVGDFLTAPYGDKKFHIYWCSHSLEHFFDINLAIEKIKEFGARKARLWVVLPYPDLDPAPAHTSSVQLGLNIDDEGKTVIKFFEDRGFKLVRHKFDDYREPEIWLDLIKDDR